jgi:hypothetical protein
VRSLSVGLFVGWVAGIVSALVVIGPAAWPAAPTPAPSQQAAAAARANTPAPFKPTQVPKPSGPTPTAAPVRPAAQIALPKVGDRVELNGIALTVRSVSPVRPAAPMLPTKPSPEMRAMSESARPRWLALVLDVVIENVGLEPAAYSPRDFGLKDNEGHVYADTKLAGDETVQLRPGRLTGGERVRGTVTFLIPDVRTQPTGLVVSYGSAELLAQQQAIRVAIPDVKIPD